MRTNDQQLGLDLGYQAAEIAGNHAGDIWKREAYAFFVLFARKHPSFTTEEVRLSSYLSEPPDRRAWGAIAKTAVDAGIISFLRSEVSPSRICHGRRITVWKSLIYSEQS